MWTQCWLNYDNDIVTKDSCADYLSTLYVEGFKKDNVISTASDELERASKALFGRSIDVDIIPI